ncbi:hypothetical protein HNY73_008447 [Argiope bruennichi]|uniref:Uncharacterized protein n=1 Tax=Argiope bruennichi TaxID=94029 RepID=A0A8T0F995_ARGBR|nr:hypothetical protein HNY73_008447 [Argiope bruennichi]
MEKKNNKRNALCQMASRAKRAKATTRTLRRYSGERQYVTLEVAGKTAWIDFSGLQPSHGTSIPWRSRIDRTKPCRIPAAVSLLEDPVFADALWIALVISVISVANSFLQTI